MVELSLKHKRLRRSCALPKAWFDLALGTVQCSLLAVRRTPLGRRLENNLRFRGKHFVTLGDTNVSFWRPGWKTVDLVNADFICDLRRDRLPFENASIDAFYSSHMIEHLSYEAGLQLFRDIYRCLKHEGFCRLVTPDMDLLLDRYKAGDWRFFLATDGRFILNQICKGVLGPESLLIHNRLVGWFASYSGRLDTGGGPIVHRQMVDERLASLPKYDFRDWCVSLLLPTRVHAHIHLYDYDELHASLKRAGFSAVVRSSYGKSDCAEMRRSPIDRKGRQMYSLYVEAKK